MPIPNLPGRPDDLQAMLAQGGIGAFNAPLSIPFMYMLPSTGDPYAQGIQQLVEGLQRILNRRGARLEVDGSMGQATVAALVPYAGPRWYDKNWVQLYGDILYGDVRPDFRAHVARKKAEALGCGPGSPPGVKSAMGDIVDDLVGNPLVLLGAGAFVYWTWFHKPSRAAASGGKRGKFGRAVDRERAKYGGSASPPPPRKKTGRFQSIAAASRARHAR